MSHKARWRNARYAFYSSVIALVCLAALAEILFRIGGNLVGVDFRVLFRQTRHTGNVPRSLFDFHPKLGYRLAANAEGVGVSPDFTVSYRTNSRGLRDREPPKRKGTILALGDSQTFGIGLPYGERLTEVIEQGLPEFEVINAGVPGWGLDQSWIYLKTEGLKFRPDTVLLFISQVQTIRNKTKLVENGFDLESLRAPNPLFDADTGIRRPDPARFPPIVYQTIDHSYLLSALAYRAKALLQGKKSRREDRQVASGSVETRTIQLIQKFQELAGRHRFRLVVVNIDTRDSLEYLRKVAGLAFFDLAPELRSQGGLYPLRFPHDGHFNARTNAFIAHRVLALLH